MYLKYVESREEETKKGVYQRDYIEEHISKENKRLLEESRKNSINIVIIQIVMREIGAEI